MVLSGNEEYLVASDNSQLYKINATNGDSISARDSGQSAYYTDLFISSDTCLAIHLNGWFQLINSSTMTVLTSGSSSSYI